MNNMYDILNKFNSVAGKQTLTEGARPDFLDLDKDGDRKEPMKQAATQAKEKEIDEVSYSAKAARAGKDIGKPGKQFAKIAKSAGERYGSKERGEKVAGAVLAKLRKEDVNEASLRQIFNRNENDNNHAENAVLLAKHFGTPEEYMQARDALAYRDSHGGYSSSDREGKKHIQTVTNLHQKYGHKIVAEADMEEGNEFTDARLAAIKAGKPTFQVGGKVYKVTGDTSDERKQVNELDISLIKAAQKHSKEHPRQVDPESERNIHKKYGYRTDRDDTGDDDDYDEWGNEKKSVKKAKGREEGPKKKGRPKGTGRSLGAKGPTGRSKLLSKGAIKENLPPGATPDDAGEYGNEGDMAKDQIHTIVRNARDLEKILRNNEDLPEWVQSKLAKIEGMMTAVSDYMQSQHERGDEMSDDEGIAVAEKAPPGDKAERMVKHIKKAYSKDGKLTPKEKSIAYATAWKAHKAGKVEEEGKEDKKDKKEVEETTVAGSVATAPAAEAPKAKGKKGSIQFGKGVYEGRLEESYKSRLETMLTEGVNINMSMDAEGGKNLTVSATDDDAVKLAQILKLAGMGSSEGYHDACPACGQSPCGCEEVEESLANSPDPVYANTDLINTQGEDLHKPKSTGQTTVPVLNKDAARQGVAHRVEKIREEAESRLWNLYKKYEGK